MSDMKDTPRLAQMNMKENKAMKYGDLIIHTGNIWKSFFVGNYFIARCLLIIYAQLSYIN